MIGIVIQARYIDMYFNKTLVNITKRDDAVCCCTKQGRQEKYLSDYAIIYL